MLGPRVLKQELNKHERSERSLITCIVSPQGMVTIVFYLRSEYPWPLESIFEVLADVVLFLVFLSPP